jgi:hypothetical protein
MMCGRTIFNRLEYYYTAAGKALGFAFIQTAASLGCCRVSKAKFKPASV